MVSDDTQLEFVEAPRTDLKNELEAWSREFGGAQIMLKLKTLADDSDYMIWLRNVLSVPEEEQVFQPKGGFTQSLLALPMSTNDDVGHREIGLDGLTRKCHTLCLQGKWREYDEADMCILEENSIIFFVKFHHRALALHLIFLFHYLSKRPVPAEFIEMGQKMKVKFRGALSRVEAASIGYSLSFSLDAGIKLNWIDYVKQSKRGDDNLFSASLRDYMLKHCPEHVDKVADWKSLQGHCTRLTTESVD